MAAGTMEAMLWDDELAGAVVDEAALDDLLAVALDRTRGSARSIAVLALGEIDHPRSVETLAELLADPHVAAEAAAALELLGSHPDPHAFDLL